MWVCYSHSALKGCMLEIPAQSFPTAAFGGKADYFNVKKQLHGNHVAIIFTKRLQATTKTAIHIVNNKK